MKAEIFKTRKQLFLRVPTFRVRYYFRLVAANGEIIAQSEGYNQKQSVTELLRKYFPSVPAWDVTGE